MSRNTTLPFDGFDAAAPETDCSAVSDRQYRTGCGSVQSSSGFARKVGFLSLSLETSNVLVQNRER